MSRPSQPLRLLLALLVLAGLVWLLSSLLQLADASLGLWQRLQSLPDPLRWAFLLALALSVAAAGWLIWKLLRPSKPRAAQIKPIDRAAIEQRAAALGEHANPATDELRELDRRRDQQALYVALFGRISSGKTSLLRALAGDAAALDDAAIAVTGGSTRQVRHIEGELADGRRLVLADVPGTEEVDDQQHAALARAEAQRAHALILVCDGELTRSEDSELHAIAGFGKPLLLVLNKADLYDVRQRAELQRSLAQRYAGEVEQVLTVSAGHRERLRRIDTEGQEQWIEREHAPRIDPLLNALLAIAQRPLATLEPAREAAVLAALDQQLDHAEVAQRLERSEQAIARYTRRAMLGALAAIAPGSDLIIQGALASALSRELAGIHGIRVRDVDLDDFLGRAGSLLQTSTSVLLAIIGNALKAFPGIGTISGGLVHAVAYGLIFHSLGHALAASFSARNRLDHEASLQAFRHHLRHPDSNTVLQLARIARELIREEASKP